MTRETTSRSAAPQQAPNYAPWVVLRKHWLLALATTALVTGTVTLHTFRQKRIYEAQATILFDPNPPRPLGRRVETVVDMGAGEYWSNQEYYETQCKIIQSMKVATAVVTKLGLHENAAFLHNSTQEHVPAEEGVKPPVAARILQGRLTVSPVPDSRLAMLKLRDASPERAQHILNILVDTYIDQNLDNTLDFSNQANDWLRHQLQGLKSDLASSETALHRYKQENDILVAFDEQSDMIRDDMNRIRAELTQAQAEQQKLAARKVVLDQVPTNDTSKIWSSELLASPLLNVLRERYEFAVAERDGLLGEGMGAKHPEVVAATMRAERAKQAILHEIENIRQSVTNDLAVANHRVGGLAGLLGQAKKQAFDLNSLEPEHNRLQRDKDNSEKLYSLVLERIKESNLTSMLEVNNIRVIDRAQPPEVAVSPRVSLNLTVGLMLGLLLGTAMSYLRVLLDRTIKVPDDIEQGLGVTFLGILPKYGSATQPSYQQRRQHGRVVEVSGAPELVVHDQPTSAAAEAIRAIRTNLIFMAPDNPHKVLLVTSGAPQDGKTTVTCSIAIAMAQVGQRVLLLDGDLRRPRIHRLFGCRSDSGLTTALLDGSYDDAIRDTEVQNLSVMPCGPVPPNPAELFHSERFKQMLEHLRGRFDRIIIDSPPVVAVTDAVILATVADGTVLVVRAGSTRKELARHALRSIHDVGGKLTGAILNAVDMSRLEYKYLSLAAYSEYRNALSRDVGRTDPDDTPDVGLNRSHEHAG